MEAWDDDARRSWVEQDFRAVRRQRRQEAERLRMPQHGRAMGVMVRNAILRRLERAEPRSTKG